MRSSTTNTVILICKGFLIEFKASGGLKHKQCVFSVREETKRGRIRIKSRYGKFCLYLITWMTSELYNEVLNNTLNLNSKKTNQFESHEGQLLFLFISLATLKLTFISDKTTINDVNLNSYYIKS